jgi:hypothetical protein
MEHTINIQKTKYMEVKKRKKLTNTETLKIDDQEYESVKKI